MDRQQIDRLNLEGLIGELSRFSKSLEIPSVVYDKALSMVEPRYHHDFRSFIERGEASEEFMIHLESNEPNNNARNAIYMVFREQMAAFHRAGKLLRSEKPIEQKVIGTYLNRALNFIKKRLY